jgi:hypothetical protein
MALEGWARLLDLQGSLLTELTAKTEPGDAQIVLTGGAQSVGVSGLATFSNDTAADIIAAGAGKIAVTALLVTNAHATVGTKVEIRDGTTVKLQGYAVALGGGFAMSGGGRPLFIGTTAAAITARCVTTGADVDVFVSGYTTT